MHGRIDPHHTAVAVGTVGFLQGVNRGVAVIGDPGDAGVVVLGDLNVQNDGVVAAAGAGIAKEIAQRVGNQGACRLVKINFVEPVGMGSDDHIHAVFLHQIDDAFLGVAVAVGALAAPVEHGDGDVRLFCSRIFQHLGDAVGVNGLVGGVIVGVEQIHAVFTAGRQAHTAEALGEGHEGHLDALGFTDGVALGPVEIILAGIGTQGFHACIVDGSEGGFQADEAVVDGTGIGHLHQVHAAAAQGIQQAIGCRGPLGAIGLTHDVAFQIQHRQVCLGKQGSHVDEGPGEIVAGHGQAGFYHAVGDIQVTGGPDVDGGGAVLLGKGLRLRLGGFGGLGGHRSFRLRSVHHTGIPDDGQHTHSADDQQNGDGDQTGLQPLLFRFLLFAHFFPPLTAFIHFVIVGSHGRFSFF